MSFDDPVYPPPVHEELTLVQSVRKSADALARHLKRLADAIDEGDREKTRPMLGILYGEGHAVPKVENGVWNAFEQLRPQIEMKSCPQHMNLNLPFDQMTNSLHYRDGSFDSASEAVFACYQGLAHLLWLAGIPAEPFKETIVLRKPPPEPQEHPTTEFPELSHEMMETLRDATKAFRSNDLEGLRKAVIAECNQVAKDIIDSWRSPPVTGKEPQALEKAAPAPMQNVQPAEYLHGWEGAVLLVARRRRTGVAGREKLLLVENGARVPMSGFGLAAKLLTRNGRHERDYQNGRFAQTSGSDC